MRAPVKGAREEVAAKFIGAHPMSTGGGLKARGEILGQEQQESNGEAEASRKAVAQEFAQRAGETHDKRTRGSTAA
jgi:hypothetical protein